MNVKTLTGPSIHAALVEARRLLGDDVILIESVPPRGAEPARVTVMIDEPRPSPIAAQAKTTTAPPAATALPYGYHTLPNQRTPAPVKRRVLEESTAESEDVTEPDDRTISAKPEMPVSTRSSINRVPGASRRGTLFPAEGNDPEPEPSGKPTFRVSDELRDQQLRLLHERLDRIERTFGDAVIGSSFQWAVQPLFAELLRLGFSAPTVSRLFSAVARTGLAPDTDEEALRWAVARELRNMLDLTAPKVSNSTQLFIGPSGSGKTSLLLKLARHTSFFGRRRTTAIIIAPENAAETSYLNPVELYRRFGIPSQTVAGEADMGSALERAQHFDQVLIDTPSMPVQEAQARKMLLRIKRLTDPLAPLQVHLTFNATRALDEFSEAYVRSLPIQPDTVALTHLDETLGWGRVAEWMIKLKLPVQFAGTGPNVPEGVTAFSPTWFIEQMMQL